MNINIVIFVIVGRDRRRALPGGREHQPGPPCVNTRLYYF